MWKVLKVYNKLFNKWLSDTELFFFIFQNSCYYSWKENDDEEKSKTQREKNEEEYKTGR